MAARAGSRRAGSAKAVPAVEGNVVNHVDHLPKKAPLGIDLERLKSDLAEAWIRGRADALEMIHATAGTVRDRRTLEFLLRSLLENGVVTDAAEILALDDAHGRALLNSRSQVVESYRLASRLIDISNTASSSRAITEGEDSSGALASDDRIHVMTGAVRRAAALRTVEGSLHRQNLLLATGNLGRGGAERQIDLMVSLLAELPHPFVPGTRLRPRPSVIVKSTRNRDTYLDSVTSTALSYYEIENQPVLSGHFADALALEGFRVPVRGLPRKVRYGLRAMPLLGDVLVSSMWQDEMPLILALPSLMAGVPVLQFVARGMPPNLRPARLQPEYAPLLRTLADVPGVVFCSNSRAAARAYEEWLGLDTGRFRVIPNAASKPSGHPQKAESDAWASFVESAFPGMPKPGPVVGHIARMEEVKRPDLAIRTFAFLLSSSDGSPPPAMVMIGSGSLRAAMEQLAVDLGVRDRILFAEASSAVGWWMERMDVIMLTSDSEGLPNVLVEAQMCGRPVVTRDVGGAGETFLDGRTGILVRQHDDGGDALPLALATAVRSALAMDRRLVARAAREFVASNFAPSVIVERFRWLAAEGMIDFLARQEAFRRSPGG